MYLFGGNVKMNTKKLFVGLIFFSLVVTYQNCSNAKFTNDSSSLNSSLGVDGNTGGNDPTCSPNMVTANKIVKVLFVMDTSGSNAAGQGSISPTDPNKKWRSATINNFINKYGYGSNFYYGLTTFQNSSSTPDIVQSKQGIFSNDQSTVQAGIQKFENTSDAGYTPYKAALSLAKNIISYDLQNNASQNAAYVMIMVSDGMATDYSDPSEVIPDAQAIENLAPQQISLNSVFYFPDQADDSQTDYLKNIANVGGGVFIKANSNSVLDIDSTVQVPSSTCQ